MKKTSECTWQYKGWGIATFGNGYRCERLKAVDGEFYTLHARSLEHAKVIINNAEFEIKCLGHIVRHKK